MAYAVDRVKYPARVATTANVATLAGGAPDPVDGISLVALDRVLVKNQSIGAQNGIYQVDTVGTGANGSWSRVVDYDGDSEVRSGDLLFVEAGTQTGTWQLTTSGTIVVGTTATTFAAFGGGNVSASPTPVNNQIAVWTDATTIEGDANLTWTGTELAVDGSVVFNDSGSAVDFRVEGDTEANLLFVDGSTDRIGIGTNTPSYLIHGLESANTGVLASIEASNSGAAAQAIFRAANDAGSVLDMGIRSTSFAPLNGIGPNEPFVVANPGNVSTTLVLGSLFFTSGTGDVKITSSFAAGPGQNVERATFKGSGEVVFNDPGNDYDFRVEGDTEANLLFVDASTDSVGVGTASPTSVFDVEGSQSITVTSVSGNTTLDSTHHTILADASGGSLVITLPAASTCSGRRYQVKKTDSSVNVVSIARSGSDTIDGATSKSLTMQYAAVTLVNDGTNWFVF